LHVTWSLLTAVGNTQFSFGYGTLYFEGS